ncbi:DUF362 domain-containing protein [candidate division KSB1 bacterium]|nr:DUF362 domain-containing protein [candidate division KSB1 bacterium]
MKKLFKTLFFPVVGLMSLIWFLIRVIPKPSRALYPCMRATFPMASTFVIYVLGLFTSVVFFKKAKKYLYQSRYVLFSITLIVGLVLGAVAFLQTDKKVYAYKYMDTTLDGPNEPMGEGVGINPGRVVWIWEPDVTNEKCTNRRNDYWWQEGNTDQKLVQKMLSEALQKLSNKKTDAAAWDAIFRNFNQTHGNGEKGYTKGEKIVVKINLNAGVSGNNYERRGLGNIDTSPQMVYALLDQLINVAGVNQEDISIGDPGRNVDQLFWDTSQKQFPNVNYWGNGNGRTPIKKSKEPQIFTSDGSMSDYLPTCYMEATYMINMPVFKKHHRAGISLTSKNHFGSFVPFSGSAFHWHFSLPASEGMGDVNNGTYGEYRCFVDFIGHKDMGGKTVLFIVDGLWGSTNWAHPPIKWSMAPFNEDWPSSIFVSQDPVAIQSVGFDFLFEEFDKDHPTEGKYDPTDNSGPFPHYAASDDFLHQAADSENWPKNTKYDPENDGTYLPRSMGVHEHWNNVKDKKYSRNLGKDFGIELVTNFDSASVDQSGDPVIASDYTLYQNYPNPFNPTTTIAYDVIAPAHVRLDIYNVRGQHVRRLIDQQEYRGHHTQDWDGRMDNGRIAPSGIYVYKLQIDNKSRSFQQTKKMIFNR